MHENDGKNVQCFKSGKFFEVWMDVRCRLENSDSSVCAMVSFRVQNAAHSRKPTHNSVGITSSRHPKSHQASKSAHMRPHAPTQTTNSWSRVATASILAETANSLRKQLEEGVRYTKQFRFRQTVCLHAKLFACRKTV